jgi:hypothetical protein
MKSFGFWNTLLFVLLVAVGCKNASKSLQRGQYDDAITRSISVLNKNPGDQKHLDILKAAYRLADLDDKDRLETLKRTGQPDIWERVIRIYENMIARNRKVESLSSSIKQAIDFRYECHVDALAEARLRAAEHFYALAVQRLETGNRFDIRRAYNDLERVIRYAGNAYRDAPRLRDIAREAGVTYVNYRVENRTAFPLPHEGIYHLGNISPETLSSFWIRYEVGSQRPDIHFEVVFTIDRFTLSPITTSSKQNSYSQTIEDGRDYVRDNSGRVILDSLGNPVTVPRRITVRCDVTEISHRRTARLGGNLAYFDVETQRWLRTFPLTWEQTATSTTFNVRGDTRALPADVARRINAPVSSLPNDMDMIISATRGLSRQIHTTMNNNKSLVR